MERNLDFRFSRLIGLMPKKAKLPLDLTKPDTFPKQFLIFNMNRLIDVFDTDRIVKSGDRFEVDKSRWFNQQYIIAKPNTELAAYLRPMISERGIDVSDDVDEHGLLVVSGDLITAFVHWSSTVVLLKGGPG